MTHLQGLDGRRSHLNAMSAPTHDVLGQGLYF